MSLVAWYPLNKDFRNLGNSDFDIKTKEKKWFIKDTDYNSGLGTRVTITGIDFSGGFEQEIIGKIGDFSQTYSRITSSGNDAALYMEKYNGVYRLTHKLITTGGANTPRAGMVVSDYIDDDKVHTIKTVYDLSTDTLYFDGVQKSQVSRTGAASQPDFMISSQQGEFKANFLYQKVTLKTYADNKTYVFEPDENGNWLSTGDSCTMNVVGSWISEYEIIDVETNVTWDNNGKIGKAASFNGNNSVLGIEKKDINKFFYDNDFSICFWVYNNDEGDRSIFLGNWGLNSIQGFNIEKSASGVLRFWWGSSVNWYFDAFIIPVQEWCHITITKSGNTFSAYKNGKLIDSISNRTLPDSLGNADWIGIGKDTRNGNTTFKGLMNDFRIYDHRLSEAEIKEIAKTKILHYNFESIYGNENLIGGSTLTSNKIRSFCDDIYVGNSVTSWGYTDDGLHIITPSSGNQNNGIIIHFTDFKNLGIDYGDTITVSVSVKGDTDNNWSCLSIRCNRYGGTWWTDWSREKRFLASDKWQRISLTVTLPEAQDDYTSNKFYIHLGNAYYGDMYWKDLKLEKGNTASSWSPNPQDEDYDEELATTIYDISGYENNGVKLSSNTPFPQYSNNSIEGNMSTEWIADDKACIVLPEEVNLPNCISVSMWGYKEDWNTTSAERLIGRATNASGWCIGDYYNENTLFGCYINGSYNTATGFKQLLSGWHLFNITFDGFNLKYYVDGEVFKSLSWTEEKQIKYSSGYKILIGSHNHYEYFFNGNIDDLRIYGTALTADDIKRLYNERVKVDNIGNMYCSELDEEERVVEYLESNNNQWIDTGFIPTANTEFEIKCQTGDADSAYDGAVFGSRTYSGSLDSFLLWNNRYYTTEQTSSNFVFYSGYEYKELTNDPHIYKFKDRKYFIDGDFKYTFSNQPNNMTLNWYVFGYNEGGSVAGRKYRGRIYYFKIWDNGELVRDFLPTISTEDGHIGELCLFDTVENKYYYNQGTGKFLTNLTDTTTNVNVTNKGVLNCRYLIEGNNPAKVLKDENIVKVNEIKEN